jgi:hypothetical protein
VIVAGNINPQDFSPTRPEETLKFLEGADREHAPLLLFLQNQPAAEPTVFDFLHSDPRYRPRVHKVALAPAF